MDDFVRFGEALFETDRLRFRGSTESDFELLQAWWSDPVLLVFQSIHAALLKSRESVIEMFRNWSQVGESGFGYSIVLKEEDKLIGHIALWGITTKDRCANLGIILNRETWGQGYGTEALRWTLMYSFLELNLHRVQLEVAAQNSRAISCYQKAGFREEGRRRQAYFRNGEWQDQVLMGVIAQEITGASYPGTEEV